MIVLLLFWFWTLSILTWQKNSSTTASPSSTILFVTLCFVDLPARTFYLICSKHLQSWILSILSFQVKKKTFLFLIFLLFSWTYKIDINNNDKKINKKNHREIKYLKLLIFFSALNFLFFIRLFLILILTCFMVAVFFLAWSFFINEKCKFDAVTFYRKLILDYHQRFWYCCIGKRKWRYIYNHYRN